MLVSEMIERLQQMQSEHGDLQVRLNCDHGQECMRATYVDLAYIEEDSYMPDYVNEAEEAGSDYIEVIEIQSY